MSISSLTNQTLDSVLSPIGEVIKGRWTKKESEQRRKRSQRLQHLEHAVKPLPSVRPRRLTVPLPEDAQLHTETKPQLTKPQSQSRFFSRLPPELRMKVYKHFFSDERIAIVKDERLRYVNWKPQDRHILPLLLTCRRVYSEAVDLLYTQAEFFFDDYDTICLFASSILPHRLNLIQRLAIQWDCVCYWVPDMRAPPPYDSYTWFQVWQIIARMEGLRELRVRIWNGPKMDRATELDVFKPLKEVTRTKVFELELPWAAHDDAHANAHADAPYKITRVRRDYDTS